MNDDRLARKLLGGALMLSALGWWAYQIYVYLRHGFWPDGSVVAFIGATLPKLAVWATHPADWIGLHTALSYTPTALIAFLFGAAIAA